MTELTDPERRCARDRARHIADEVRAMGGCAACKHRAIAWGSIYCGLKAQRRFPACIDSDFKLDETTLTRAA